MLMVSCIPEVLGTDSRSQPISTSSKAIQRRVWRLESKFTAQTKTIVTTGAAAPPPLTLIGSSRVLYIYIYIYIYEDREKKNTETANCKMTSINYLLAIVSQKAWSFCCVKNPQSQKVPGRERQGIRKVSRKALFHMLLFLVRNRFHGGPQK